MHLSRPTPVSTRTVAVAREFRGVYDGVANDPPEAPGDARAAIVKDSTGRTIAFVWVVSEHAEGLTNHCWDWLDERDRPAMPPPELRVIR